MNCCTSGFGLFRISSGVPCATIEPWPSIIMRVAMRKALVMSWETTTAVMWLPCVSFKVSSSTTAVMIGSRPEVGSSLNSNSGSRASARASPTRFFIPPLISSGLRSSKPVSPTISSFCFTICSISSGDLSVCCASGRATFSPTVSDASSAPD